MLRNKKKEEDVNGRPVVESGVEVFKEDKRVEDVLQTSEVDVLKTNIEIEIHCTELEK